MATAVTDCGNIRIVTQVVPQTGPQSSEVTAARMLESNSTVSQIMSPQIKKFNTLPKALGVVQIVLGATQISFGIALTVAQEKSKNLTVKSGVYFWIGILLLVSGSLLVEMEKRKYIWLVKASLLTNLLIILAALIATILHAVEIAKDTCFSTTFHCNTKEVLTYGLNSVFIILSLLEISTALTALVTRFKISREQHYRWMIL